MSSIMKYSATTNSFTVSPNTISCSNSQSSGHENNLLVLYLGPCSPVSMPFETKLVFMLLSCFLGQFKNCHIPLHILYSLAISHVGGDTSKLKSCCQRVTSIERGAVRWLPVMLQFILWFGLLFPRRWERISLISDDPLSCLAFSFTRAILCHTGAMHLQL